MPTVPTVSGLPRAFAARSTARATSAPARLRGPLDGQGALGSRQQRVVPGGHHDRPRVPALAVERHAVAAGPGDVLDDPDRYPLLLEDRALLNVQLDERMVVARGQPHRFQRARVPRGGAELIE